MFRILLVFLFALSLHADEHLEKAAAYFHNEEYAKAFEIYEHCTHEAESAEAAYKLGWMYENGKGVSADHKKALVWYKKAAKWDLAKSNKEKVYEAVYSNMDPVGDEESTETLVQLVTGSFGLRAYYPNYAIVSYTDVVPNGDLTFQDPNVDPHYINTETKFQISLRADYMTEWFGFSQMWTGAYTQTSYWQIFINSSPFRETNYKPELFVTIPFYHKLDTIGMKAVSFGYKHSSNGQPVDTTKGRDPDNPNGPYIDSRSRSWNRLYARAYFQWQSFFAELTLWHRMEENIETDDNPDILDYYGHGSLELGYIHKKLLTRLTLRPSFHSGNFTGELEMSYPVPLSDNIFFFLQGFSGYGQSLIDYDHKVNQVGFGLSISR